MGAGKKLSVSDVQKPTNLKAKRYPVFIIYPAQFKMIIFAA